MRATSLPSVLSPAAPDSPISMERALKQIIWCLEELTLPVTAGDEDRLNASLDDAKVMLASINRG